MTQVKQIVQEVLEAINYNEYISPEEAARRLEVHPNTIRDWCNEGKIPFTKFSHKCLRIKTQDFIAFCKDCEC